VQWQVVHAGAPAGALGPLTGRRAAAQALLGALQLQRKNFPLAKEAFSGLLGLEGFRGDHYGMLGMAAYHAAMAPRNAKKPEEVGGGPAAAGAAGVGASGPGGLAAGWAGWLAAGWAGWLALSAL
jgi:hypothetical protein